MHLFSELSHLHKLLNGGPPHWWNRHSPDVDFNSLGVFNLLKSPLNFIDLNVTASSGIDLMHTRNYQ